MNFFTTYSPPTFLRPCLLISTLFTDNLQETAVAFVEALNGNHAIRVMASQDADLKKTKFIVIKRHKNLDSAMKFHIGLAKKMQNGRSEKIWHAGYKHYLAIYDEYCPDDFKKRSEN